MTFSGLGATNARLQAVVSEFYNVASAAAFDGSSSSPTSLAPGAITTRASGDLIYQWGVDFSDTNAYGGAFNGTGIFPGADFTLLSADLQVGSSDQYYIQPNAGVISSSFTTSGSATWGSVALALKSATAGTPPSSGIRIVHVQHTLLTASRSQGRTTPTVMQFPFSGNLLVGLYNSADVSVFSVVDNVLNNWVSAGLTLGGGLNDVAQILYAANAATGPNLDGIAVTLTGISTGDVMFVLYDVAGADASPFDKATTAFGIQLGGGNLTTASLAPSTPNELVFNETSIDFHTINGLIGTGFTLDSVVNAYDNDDPPNGGTDASTLDEDNGYAHVHAPTTSLLTFTYTYTRPSNGGVQTWGSTTWR